MDINKSKFEIGYLIGEKNFWGGHYSSMVIFNLLKIGFLKMGLNKCIGYVEETHAKARMTNKFSGYKEIKKLNSSMKNLIKMSPLLRLRYTKKIG